MPANNESNDNTTATVGPQSSVDINGSSRQTPGFEDEDKHSGTTKKNMTTPDAPPADTQTNDNSEESRRKKAEEARAAAAAVAVGQPTVAQANRQFDAPQSENEPSPSDNAPQPEKSSSATPKNNAAADKVVIQSQGAAETPSKKAIEIATLGDHTVKDVIDSYKAMKKELIEAKDADGNPIYKNEKGQPYTESDFSHKITKDENGRVVHEFRVPDVKTSDHFLEALKNKGIAEVVNPDAEMAPFEAANESEAPAAAAEEVGQSTAETNASESSQDDDAGMDAVGQSTEETSASESSQNDDAGMDAVGQSTAETNASESSQNDDAGMDSVGQSTAETNASESSQDDDAGMDSVGQSTEETSASESSQNDDAGVDSSAAETQLPNPTNTQPKPGSSRAEEKDDSAVATRSPNPTTEPKPAPSRAEDENDSAAAARQAPTPKPSRGKSNLLAKLKALLGGKKSASSGAQSKTNKAEGFRQNLKILAASEVAREQEKEQKKADNKQDQSSAQDKGHSSSAPKPTPTSTSRG